MKSEKDLRDLYSLAQQLITTAPASKPPEDAHVMLWMAIGYALGQPEHAHLPDDARRILAERRASRN